MPVFKWQGKNRQGEVVRGQMEAANASVAVLNLRKQQIVPIQVKPEKAKSSGFSFQLGRRIKEKEVAVFTRQLATMMSSGVPLTSPQHVRWARLESVTTSTRDCISQVIPAFGTRSYSGSTGERLAFAPPFGPNLRGIIGRPAGTVEGFTYSNTMMKTLKGMEWSEAALNVWITDPQAWVPGVYMYYKQKDPEIRRKIILYLKANP